MPPHTSELWAEGKTNEQAHFTCENFNLTEMGQYGLNSWPRGHRGSHTMPIKNSPKSLYY